MATQRQIESAHINGAKSRGPKTPEGKRRSAANARKHGLASKTLSPGAEMTAEFRASVDRYVAALRPASPRELLLIHQMVASKIRQRQSWAAETDALNRALAAHDGCMATAFHALAESNELACILRYETRFKRQYDRAMQEFLAIRALRLPNEPDRTTTTAPPDDRFCETNGSRTPGAHDSAERTGSIPIPPRRPCSHPSFLPNEPDSRRSIRNRARDKVPRGSI